MERIRNRPEIFSAIVCVVIGFLSGCHPVGEHHPEWKKYFDEYGVAGCMDIYDLQKKEFVDYNPDRCHSRYTPASTFKIFNSLMALQTAVVPDEKYVLPWDGTVHVRESWNHDQDMAEAIRNSTVWYYQEIARRVGEQKMQQYLEVAHYGNAVIGGAIDSFWLSRGLRISCDEQIEFLKNFYTYQVPFSKRNVDLVKKIIVLDSTDQYKLSGKTGWGMHQQPEDSVLKNIGWFVGYVENGSDVYFFALNIESPEPAPGNFAEARIEIAKNILRDSGILLAKESADY